MKLGKIVIGKYVGYSKTPWTNDPSKFNHRVCLEVGNRTDEFGVVHPENLVMDIDPSDVCKFDDMSNKVVRVDLAFRMKEARNGNKWLSVWIPKGSDVVEIKTPSEVKKAG